MRKFGDYFREVRSEDGVSVTENLLRGVRPHMAKVHWADVAGPQIASVTQVERVESGPGRCVLVVRAKNGVWANELTLLKSTLLAGLNDRLGGPVITDIRFKASGLAKGSEGPENGRAAKIGDAKAAELVRDRDAVGLHESERSRIEAAVSEITDPALRDRVYRSLVQAAQTALWRRKQGWIACARCRSLMPHPGGDAEPICSVCAVVDGAR